MPFFKKTELYNIFNQFPFLEMGKILKFLTEDNQFNFLVTKERISQQKHNRLAMHCQTRCSACFEELKVPWRFLLAN